MNKGIVLKINPSSVIVLTSEGEYLKCKKLLSSYAIGEEIQFPNHAVILNKKFKAYIPKLVPVMIASALILMSVVFVNWNKERVLAAGSVKLNSKAKVSLIINKQLKVIDLKAQNEQGKEVIEHMKDWKKESLQKVTDHLIVEMEKKHIIQEDEKVTISGSMGKKYKSKQNHLNQELTNIKNKNSQIEVQGKKDRHDDDKKNQNKKNDLNKNTNKHNDNHSIKNQTKNDSKIMKKNDHINSSTFNTKPSKDSHHGNSKKNVINHANGNGNHGQNGRVAKKQTGNRKKGHSVKKNRHDEKGKKGYRGYHKKNHRVHNQNNVNEYNHDKERNWDEKGRK